MEMRWVGTEQSKWGVKRGVHRCRDCGRGQQAVNCRWWHWQWCCWRTQCGCSLLGQKPSTPPTAPLGQCIAAFARIKLWESYELLTFLLVFPNVKNKSTIYKSKVGAFAAAAGIYLQSHRPLSLLWKLIHYAETQGHSDIRVSTVSNT